MKADTVDLATIFGKPVRYLVPLFQRPYVWNLEKQWEPLWDDIQAVAPVTLGHRIFFTPVYELRRAQIADELVAQILEKVPTPR